MVAAHPPVTGAVLVGGSSSRMGTDKASLVVDGTTLLERTVATLRSVCGEVLIVTGAGQGAPHVARSERPLRVVHDHWANAGPLAGLEAALDGCHTELLIVVAVDMPYLSADVLSLQIAAARADHAVDVVTLRGAHGLEPLHAVYRRRLLPDVRRLLNAGERSMASLLAAVRCAWLAENAVAQVDPEHRSATNLNGPDGLLATSGAALA